jgi:hypothetical protein
MRFLVRPLGGIPPNMSRQRSERVEAEGRISFTRPRSQRDPGSLIHSYAALGPAAVATVSAFEFEAGFAPMMR